MRKYAILNVFEQFLFNRIFHPQIVYLRQKNLLSLHVSFSNLKNSSSSFSAIVTNDSIYTVENKLWDGENQMKI